MIPDWQLDLVQMNASARNVSDFFFFYPTYMYTEVKKESKYCKSDSVNHGCSHNAEVRVTGQGKWCINEGGGVMERLAEQMGW